MANRRKYASSPVDTFITSSAAGAGADGVRAGGGEERRPAAGEGERGTSALYILGGANIALCLTGERERDRDRDLDRDEYGERERDDL